MDEIKFVKALHFFCTEHDIDEVSLTFKTPTDIPNPRYEYVNLDDNECEFGREGDILSNYEFR